MVEVNLDYLPFIEPLYELASASIEPTAFRIACESLGHFVKSSSFEDLWYFRVAPKLVLIVSLEVGNIGMRERLSQALCEPLAIQFAVLSFCWWEAELQSNDSNFEIERMERALFDRAFSDALAHATKVWGEPLQKGRDLDERGHRWAIWRGRTSLLVLQQRNYDPQFGRDVNFWLQPWVGPVPQPGSPLIAWLTAIR